MSFQGIRTSFAKKSYIFVIVRGGGGGDPVPLPPLLTCPNKQSHTYQTICSKSGMLQHICVGSHVAVSAKQLYMFYQCLPRDLHTAKHKKVSEYDQEIPQSQTTDQPMAPRGNPRHQEDKLSKLSQATGSLLDWSVNQQQNHHLRTDDSLSH